MNILYIILATLGSIILLMALFALLFHVIGKRLSPDHVHACTIRLNQPPEAIYDTLLDASRWPEWDHGVRKVSPLPDVEGHPACRMLIGSNSMLLVTTRAERPILLERTIRDEGRKLVFSGSWTHELTPDPSSHGQSTLLRLTERGTIHIPIARAMARKLADPKLYLKRHLTRLAKKFGEEAKIEDA